MEGEVVLDDVGSVGAAVRSLGAMRSLGVLSAQR